MQNYGKAWWTLIVIQCTAVSAVFGAYYGIKTNIIALKNELHSLEQRVGVLEGSLKIPSLLPAPVSSATVATIQSAALNRSASDREKAPVKNEQSSKGTGNSVESEKPSERTTCVNKMTHTIFACERAAKCLGPNNFDGNYFKKLRMKLGLGDSGSMMICGEKTAEPEAAPAETN